jgi:hypothetical protein
MVAQINLSKTEPFISNTLPKLFSSVNNAAYFKYDFAACAIPDPNKLVIRLEYLVLRKDGNVIGSYITQTTYTIRSKNEQHSNFEIFYLCLATEVKNFKQAFEALGVQNYSLQKVIVPSYNQVYPVLEDIYTVPLS